MKKLHKFTIVFVLLSLIFNTSGAGVTHASPMFAPVLPSGLNGNGPGGVGTTDGSSALELWLRPDRGVFTDAACSVVAVNGNAVYCWADQSGNGANATQATAANRALYYTTTAANLVNGQPTVRLDGANDYFNIPASVIQGRTAFSFFTAFRWNAVSYWQRLWDFGSGTNNNGFITVRSNGNTPRFAIKPAPNTTEQQLSFSTALPTGSGQLIDVIWNASGGTGWRNGSSQATRSAASWTPSNLGTITLHYIGRSIYAADPYLNANIGEFIVYSSALNDTNRILVDNYLSSKYNVAIANDVYAGDTAVNGDFDLDVAGIGQLGGNQHTVSHAAGMIVVNGTFLNADGDWLLFGHNTVTNSTTTADLPVTGTWLNRWARNWYVDLTDAGVAGGTVDIIFDYSDSGLGGTPTYPAGAYRLLSRVGTSGAFSDITATSGATVTISGDQVQFLGVNVSQLDGQTFTLGIGDTIAPTVTVEQASGQADPTGTSPINFTATYSEPINKSTFDETDITLGGTAPGTLTAVVTEDTPNDGTTFNIAVSGMTGNGTVTVSIDANMVQDLVGNDNEASTSTDNEVTYDNTNPTVVSTDLVASYTTNGPSSFIVTFSKDVYDPTGDDDNNDVTNPANYLLVEAGTNGNFDTTVCGAEVGGGLQPDDTQVAVSSVSYDSTTFTATVTLASAPPVGSYKLFVCGTTSIVDSANNHLNGGSDYTFNFTVTAAPEPAGSSLPATGFAPGRVTPLPAQPASKAYSNVDMKLEIPSLGVTMPIVGIPVSNGKWDVTWLGNSAGYLAGSAFPTWNGNTVLTGHVWDANNQPGPFVGLKSLKYGDQVLIHAWGLTYTYEVRESKVFWGNGAVSKVFQHEELDWVTLLTCETYNPFTGDYFFRRSVRAVLVSVK